MNSRGEEQGQGQGKGLLKSKVRMSAEISAIDTGFVSWGR
jgi:hypothetical protein